MIRLQVILLVWTVAVGCRRSEPQAQNNYTAPPPSAPTPTSASASEEKIYTFVDKWGHAYDVKADGVPAALEAGMRLETPDERRVRLARRP